MVTMKEVKIIITTEPDGVSADVCIPDGTTQREAAVALMALGMTIEDELEMSTPLQCELLRVSRDDSKRIEQEEH